MTPDTVPSSSSACLQAEARQAKQSQIKLDAEQLEKLLFRLFERKVMHHHTARPVRFHVPIHFVFGHGACST